MQRHHSDLTSHAQGSFEARAAQSTSGAFATRGTRSLSGVLQRSLAHQSIPHPGGSASTPPTSLEWWVITQPGTGLSLPAQLSSPASEAVPAGPIGGALKRALDVAVASLALILLAPLLLMTALLIKATMGGPVLFAHSRVGLNGKVFRCYKFRTMVNDAEERLRRYLDQDPRIAREWQETCKLAHDPRVTSLGQLLRKASVDELPQLINVLRGDMSCVGPRPITAIELQRYGARAADYLKTRPGLTGLWQVSGRSSLSYASRVELDGLYVRNWSMLLDLAILVRTLPAILKFNQAA
ncbi:MAG: exopolysaccharide biosynthesis protein [Sphingomonadales bacterium]|nr:exopolysaccharide biosynthesis protein [Sphingomonadales bacterium]